MGAKEAVDIAPDDVVGAVLGYSGLSQFSSSKKFLHTNFYKFYRQGMTQCPELFDQFVFSSGESYPFSRLLERVLIRLQVAGVIVADNPKYRAYRMEKEERRHMIANSERRLPKYIPVLKRFGKTLAKAQKAGASE